MRPTLNDPAVRAQEAAAADVRVATALQWIDQFGLEFGSRLIAPTPDDLSIIGAILQEYAAADFNCRLLLDVFAGRPMLSPLSKENYSDSALFDALQSKLKQILSPVEYRPIEEVFPIFKLNYFTRNLCAHWMCGRHPTENVLFFWTKNSKEGGRRIGDAVNPRSHYLAAIDVCEMVAIATNVHECTGRLVRRSANWIERFGVKPE